MRLSKRRQGQGETSAHSGKASMSFEKALEAFLLAQDAANHSGFTYTSYKRMVRIFLGYMEDVHRYTSVDQITETDILGWLSYLRNSTSSRGKQYSSRSVETYCRNVRVFFNWLVKHNHLAVNPMAQVKLPKVEKALIRVFTEEELERLDAACDRPAKGKSLTSDERKTLASRDRAFLWLLLSTGIRMSEACGLLFSDIDWDSGMIYVRGKGRKSGGFRWARSHAST